eukprot:TRINITY_DN6390_c0_g6_i1.p3 TRINITY_DN6390_c0_g6~~TRINITY_DN6390_c0_g6_i1.p3  ORF type:complete len:163 (+),score=23.29 TRINITY_DN6390_c0_g6_i1:626-1114(+)
MQTPLIPSTAFSLCSSNLLSYFRLQNSIKSGLPRAVETLQSSQILFEPLENLLMIQKGFEKQKQISQKQVEVCGGKRHTNRGKSKWTKAEIERFAMGYKRFGSKWNAIHCLIPSKSVSQIRKHAKRTVLKNEVLKKQCSSLSFIFTNRLNKATVKGETGIVL